MIIREYTPSDKEKCIDVFDSNYPKFFDIAERGLFIKWLDHQADNSVAYKSPVYKNAEKDAYYIIEIPGHGIVGCGGFYVLKESREARLAWGMIHSAFHKQGYGKALYNHRIEIIKSEWPGYAVTLGTSQHTYPFYQRMGMKVVATIKDGYGAGLDRYDMEQ